MSEKLPAKLGRPSTYSQELADEICERISNGESLITILRKGSNSGGYFPPYGTVMRWQRENDAFRQQYAQAKQDQADYYAELITDVSSAPILMDTVKMAGDGSIIEVTRADAIAHRRLQVDTLKWIAGKLKPRFYGDRLIHTSDDAGPVKIEGGLPDTPPTDAT